MQLVLKESAYYGYVGLQFRTHTWMFQSAKLPDGHFFTQVAVLFSAKYPVGHTVTHDWVVSSAQYPNALGH